MMTSNEIARRAEAPDERADLLRELVGTNHPEALRLATRFADDEDYEVRVAALSCVGAAGDVASRPLLRKGLTDEEPLVRVAAIEALVALGSLDDESLGAVERLLDDQSEMVRAYAGWALGRVGSPSAEAPLARRLPVEPSAVAKAGIVEGLYRLTSEALYLDMLQELLEDSDPEARAFTSNSMVGVATKDNAKQLIERLVLALNKESYPAIRDVIESNLQTLVDMVEDDNFELE